VGIKKQLRLRDSRDFARLRQEGQAYRHPMMTLNIAANALQHNRYGFVTAKRLGNAVTRNRIRRQLREAVRHLHPSLQPGYDIVVVARQDVEGKSFQQISDALQVLFHKAQLFGEQD